MGLRFKGGLGHKYLETIPPTERERILLVFIVGIRCLKLKTVTAVAGASSVESA